MNPTLGILVAIAALAFLAGLAVGRVWRRRAQTLTPYITADTPEANAYRAARGLPPGAPIPRREYWRAVEAGEIENPPWVKTPDEMG